MKKDPEEFTNGIRKREAEAEEETAGMGLKGKNLPDAQKASGIKKFCEALDPRG